MVVSLIDIYFAVSIFSLCVLLLLLKRHDVILTRYEGKEEYKGFLKDVLKSVIDTGGIFNPTTILPWFDFSDKDEFEKKHLISKNWLLLLFLLIMISIFIVGYIDFHKK